MPRNRPCLECKKSRRKCAWLPDSKDCERCVRLGLDCQRISKDQVDLMDLDDDYDDDEAAECGKQELRLWTKEVAELQNEITKLERDLGALAAERSRSAAAAAAQYLLASNEQETTTMATKHNSPQWKLSIVDGKLRLETDIKNISELLSYGLASLRYLSPFSGLFEQEPVYFQGSEGTIIPRAFQAVCKMFSEQQSKQIQMSLSMYPLKINPCMIVEHLINEYLATTNNYRPLLHAPTYIRHYRKLKDVMQDPITLAVCSAMSIIMRSRSGTTNTVEKRRLAEYFYLKCKDILFDMFDDPSRRIETVITISFLQHFVMFVMLNFHEARRLGTIAHMILKDLQVEAENGDLAPVELALFQRHDLFISTIMHMLDLFVEDRFSCDVPDFQPLDVLPDETPEAKEHVRLFNHLLRLGNTDYMRYLFRLIHHMLNGDECAVHLDVIFQHEQHIMDWWKSVPKDLRLCDNPFSADVYELVEEVDSIKKAVFFASLHAVTMAVHCSFLRPRTGPAAGGISEKIAGMIREHARTIAIRSAELLIKSIKQISKHEHLAAFTLEYMIQLLNSLSILYGATGTVVSQRAQEDMKMCLENIGFLLIPKDHNVPSSSSPLLSFFKSGHGNDLKTYFGYPLPGYAFLDDLFRAGLAHLHMRSSTMRPVTYSS